MDFSPFTCVFSYYVKSYFKKSKKSFKSVPKCFIVIPDIIYILVRRPVTSIQCMNKCRQKVQSKLTYANHYFDRKK